MKTMIRSLNYPLLFFILGLSAVGCNSSKLPATVQIQGKVTWQGKPLSAGSVAFNPVALSTDKPSRPAVGDLSADGVYRLSSFRPNDGVMPGEYHVTVDSCSSRPTAEDPNSPLISRIPRHYADPEKSGLTFLVPADAHGPLTYDIDLK